MSKIYTSAEMLVGNTPIVELTGIENKLALGAKILAKLEFMNPGGSIKDRVAKSMLDEAEKEGRITKDSTIIEPTSGNTGIGLALLAAVRGYRAIIVMPDSMSPERIKLMKAYGAEVVLTEGKKGMAGAIAKAKELLDELPGSIIAGQFENPANPKAHFDTTGPEIYSDTDGKTDIFVAGVGTGGTITGAGGYLKAKNTNIRVVGVEPENSPYLSKRTAGSHKIQGIGAGFVPEVLDEGVYDEIICISDEKAYEFTRLVARTDGILVGISAGAALCAAVELAKRSENKGKNIVVIFPDSGSRYLSGDLFEV